MGKSFSKVRKDKSMTYYDKTRKKAFEVINMDAYMEKHPDSDLIEVINMDAYMEKHPDSDLIAVKMPSIKTMHKWMADGISRTPCKCRVEPDGYCLHGAPSWLLLLGVI